MATSDTNQEVVDYAAFPLLEGCQDVMGTGRVFIKLAAAPSKLRLPDDALLSLVWPAERRRGYSAA